MRPQRLKDDALIIRLTCTINDFKFSFELWPLMKYLCMLDLLALKNRLVSRTTVSQTYDVRTVQDENGHNR